VDAAKARQLQAEAAEKEKKNQAEVHSFSTAMLNFLVLTLFICH
jgi:hypothetical protein